MRRYANQAQVLFVDPPRPAGYEVMLGFARTRLQQVSPTLSALTLTKALPLDRTIKPLKTFNNYLVKHTVDNVSRRLGIQDHVLWCYHFDGAMFNRPGKTRLIVYDCVDDWAALSHSYGEVVEKEKHLVAISDLVFTTAERLYYAKKRINPNTYLVPNGADYEHFKEAASSQEAPVELEQVSHPMIGFSGGVFTWVALDMVEAIAGRRPDWSFVFIGPVGKTIRKPQVPNVHFLGKVSYEVLPHYVSQFDVCIMPFLRNELTESVNPIKMYEYMATGKPIVSTGLPEVTKFAQLIRIADNPDDFEKAIDAALKEHDSSLVQARQIVASKNSWDSRFETMMKLVEERLSARKLGF
jgi:glycosyltransferase involved in cell wall biosynthesis